MSIQKSPRAAMKEALSSHASGRFPPNLILCLFRTTISTLLRRVSGRSVGVRLIPRVHRAYPIDGVLLDAVDRVGRRDAGRFEDGRDDVDDVMELAADAAHIIDVGGPGNGHALGRPAEVRCHLLQNPSQQMTNHSSETLTGVTHNSWQPRKPRCATSWRASGSTTLRPDEADRPAIGISNGIAAEPRPAPFSMSRPLMSTPRGYQSA